MSLSRRLTVLRYKQGPDADGLVRVRVTDAARWAGVSEREVRDAVAAGGLNRDGGVRMELSSSGENEVLVLYPSRQQRAERRGESGQGAEA